MDDGMKPFEHLLREVARVSDQESRASARALTRSASQRALVRWGAHRRWHAPARRAIFALAAAAMFAAAMLVAATHRSPDALSFVVGESGEPGKVGAWMASPPSGLPLRFSEGTQIVLQAGTSARVTRSDEHGADLLLERGELQAHVIHRDAATGWTVHAGPFEIRVVGTSFDTKWDPGEGSLDVGVTEGRVVVTGPLLEEGRAVRSDERLRVSLKTSTFEVSKPPTAFAAATDGSKPASGEPPQAASAQPAATEAPSASASASASAVAHASPSASASAGGSNGWRDLARAGQHRAALEAAMALGYDRVVSESSASDLLLLADIARYSGDVGHAKQALLAARSRGEKGRSAFLLGKLAADSSGAPGEAAQWFETYLGEAPGGALAEQALGRLIELYRRTGRTGQAQSAATKYLAKYPNGGYANAARSVLGQ
jgi:hypothetical protein